MANERAYVFVGAFALAANGQGTIQFTLPAGEAFRGSRLWFSSTGAFSVTGIRDTAGRDYSNASSGNAILSTMLQKPQTAGGGVGMFVPPLEIRPGLALSIDLLDTSAAANTVVLALEGERFTP